MATGNFIDRLRCSSTLRPPSAADLAWLDDQARDQRGSTTARPRRASLSLVLREDVAEGKVEMLVIKRAMNLRDKWSGHIALPGGRQEAGETELQAAVRECKEEVGLSLISSRFELLGRLKDSRTSTSKDALTVSCFVFVQTDGLDSPLTIQVSEVAFAWWIDTAIFYPNPAPQEAGFAVTSMVGAARKPHWKALMWLFGAETAFFPCFFLPPPPSSGHTPVHDSATASAIIAYPLGAETYVMWGLTLGVVSDLAVAGGGRAFAYQGPPYFRISADFLAISFYRLRGWSSGLRGMIDSS